MKRSLTLETTWAPVLRALCLSLVLLGFLPSLCAEQFGLFTYEKMGKTIEITGYPQNAIGPVEIPAVIDGLPVTSIGGGAFHGCTGLTRVTMPSTLTSFSIFLFQGCTSLTAIHVEAGNPTFASESGVLFDAARARLILCPPGWVGPYTIPAGVNAIGEYAFSGCTALTRVSIPPTLTSIPSDLFQGCTGLTAIHVEAGNPTYASESGVLFDATRAGLILCPPGRVGPYTIPSTVTEIRSWTFYGCTGLTAIHVEAGNPAYVSDDGVLLNAARTLLLVCPEGKTGAYTIPSSVTEIRSWAFYGCTSLTAIQVEAGNPTYASESGVLLDAARARIILCPPGRVGHYSIPSTVSSISQYAFSGCSKLTSVTIPSSVTAIGELAFYGWTGLTSVTIPSSVTHIGWGAFFGCTGLTNVTIPSSVQYVGYSAFFNCTRLTHIEVMSDGPVVNGNTLSLRLPAATDGLWCQVETSTDLIHWTTTGVTTSGAGPDGLRTASVSIDGPQRFMRVVVIPVDDPLAGV